MPAEPYSSLSWRCVPACLQKLRLPAMQQQAPETPAPLWSPGEQQASDPIDLDPPAGSEAADRAASPQAASLCELPAPARRSRPEPLLAQPSPVATASGGAAEICEQPAAHGVPLASLPSSLQPSLPSSPAPSPPRGPCPASGAAPADCALLLTARVTLRPAPLQRVAPGETVFTWADTTALVALVAVASALVSLADTCQGPQCGCIGQISYSR